MNKTKNLLEQLDHKQNHRHSYSLTMPTKRMISKERDSAENNYKDFTNLTKNQQCDFMRQTMKMRRRQSPDWKYDSYRINNSFSLTKQENMQEFPHNNKKYNVQFLERTLRQEKLKFPKKDTGLFPAPKDSLYSKHYKPIVVNKREYNQTYQLRTSLFGKTWVDKKRDRIMDQYMLQTNPFHTQHSNALISTMRPSRKHRFS